MNSEGNKKKCVCARAPPKALSSQSSSKFVEKKKSHAKKVKKKRNQKKRKTYSCSPLFDLTPSFPVYVSYVLVSLCIGFPFEFKDFLLIVSFRLFLDYSCTNKQKIFAGKPTFPLLRGLGEFVVDYVDVSTTSQRKLAQTQ